MIVLVLVYLSLQANNTLTESDWQHVLIPGGMYIIGAQSLRLAGYQEDSDYISLAFVLMANIGKEYYDYRCGGVSSLTDLQLSVTGIITSYYLNKAFCRFVWR